MPSEYRAVWSTAGGGTGYTVLHFQDVVSNTEAQNTANAVRTFFNSLAGIFPDEVSITFDDEVLVKDLAGTLLSVWPVTPPASVAGINASTYNRAAGARIDWSTGHIVAGRRLTGRTYLVPAGSSVFDIAGLVTSANVTAMTNAATALITATSSIKPLVVWSRTHGVAWAASGVAVPTKGAILTGRRD
jgi:hypothetical protein